MQIVESQRIIITAWLKCTLNKSACAELSPAPQAKRGPRGSSKVHSFGSGIFFFARFKRVLISLFTVAVFLAEQHLNHM